MKTRSGKDHRSHPKPVEKKPPRKRKISESEEDDEKPVHLDGETVFERLESLLKKTNNFSIPITQADIKAVHGERAKTVWKKQKRLNELDMVAQGYDRTATFYDKTPEFINGEMRDYQIEGMNWMISLQKAGLNGILADEMGLGKTLQSIALLAHNKLVEKAVLPSLVIAPLPTVLNWGDEFQRFCPQLKVIVLQGLMEERRAQFRKGIKKGDIDVFIMSYETAINAAPVIRKHNLNYVIIDEAQRIKNEKVSLAVAVRSLRSSRRLLLTGTPFQNNVHELWALLYYLVPALFDDCDSFDEYFSSASMSDEVELINRLHRILNPFMLRRVKHDVEKSLLPKKEYKILMGLSDLQKEWYKKVLRKEIEIMNNEGKILPKKVYHILMHLREVSNHPYMFPAAEPSGPPFVTDESIVKASGKMMVLDKMLEKFKAEGSRCLIFSQFTMMLDIIEDYAIWKDIKYSRFDGKTVNDERFEKVREFNSEGSETFMFLMSTRSGGLGINLASADVVIIFDSDWNPQMDFQAIARAHRIGQKKQVRVFRLITQGTVDEYIIRTNEHKVRLGAVIIQDSQARMETTKTKHELLEMLNEAEHAVMAGELESIGEIDLDKMIKDAEDLAEEQAREKREKMAEDNKYLVQAKKDHEIWEYSGQNHWVDSRKQFEDFTVEGRLRKNPKMAGSEDRAFTSSEFWNRYGMYCDHQHNVCNYRFYPARYLELCQKMFTYLNAQNQILYFHHKPPKVDKNSPCLSDEELEELQKLQTERVCNWSYERFSVFIDNLRTVDRFNYVKLAKSITSEVEDVIKYSDVLWQRIDELPNKSIILSNVESYKIDCENNKEKNEMIKKKADLFENPAIDMFFNYSLLEWDNRFQHSEPEDRFIAMYLAENGHHTYTQPLMQAAKQEPRSGNWPCMKAGAGMVKDRMTYLVNLMKKELQDPVYFLPTKFAIWTEKQVKVWLESFLSTVEFQSIQEVVISGESLAHIRSTDILGDLPPTVRGKIIEELGQLEDKLENGIAMNQEATEIINKKLASYESPEDIKFNYSLVKWDEKCRTYEQEDQFMILWSHRHRFDITDLRPMMEAFRSQPRYYNWPCYRAGYHMVKQRLLYLTKLLKKEEDMVSREPKPEQPEQKVE
ncbi:unnamed protein product [Caenorhabditis brenneri]